MFVVISLVFSICINFPVSAAFPFIKFDISDVPIFLSTMIFGLHDGIIAFFSTLILRTLFLSSAGIVGFLIRFATLGVIFGVSVFHKNSKLTFKNLVIIFLSVFLSLAVKLPISYVLWRFLGLGKEILNASFFTFVVPFNFFKTILNIVLAIIFYKKVLQILKIED